MDLLWYARKDYNEKTPAIYLTMQTVRPLFRTLAASLLVLGVLISGCSSDKEYATGTVSVTSNPTGAEVYLDHEYHGTTPTSIIAVPAGSHIVEVREHGYDTWSAPVTVSGGIPANISANLVPVLTTMPVTYVTITPTMRKDLPQIHIDGYWTYPQSRGSSNPVPLLVHIDGFNVGYADAREVTASANLYYEGRMVCWNTVYLGTLKAGGHVGRDTMVSCTLPSGMNDPDLTIRFENIVVTP